MLFGVIKPKYNRNAWKGFEDFRKKADDFYPLPERLVNRWKKSLRGTKYEDGAVHFQLKFGEWTKTIEGEHWQEIRLLNKKIVMGNINKNMV